MTRRERDILRMRTSIGPFSHVFNDNHRRWTKQGDWIGGFLLSLHP